MANLKVKFVTYTTAAVSFVSDVRICGQLKPTLIKATKTSSPKLPQKIWRKKTVYKIRKRIFVIVSILKSPVKHCPCEKK